MEKQHQYYKVLKLWHTSKQWAAEITKKIFADSMGHSATQK